MSRDPEHTPPTRATPPEDVPLRPPRGARYVRQGLLGQGGMGEVYRVTDTLLGRELAMKVLRRELTAAQGQAFVAEARLTASLQHPAIAAVHDAGVGEDGRPWFTMPIVQGSTLRAQIEAVHAASRGGTWRAAEGWNLHRLVAAVAGVANAVAYAHMKGVVHRDLKPDNVMLGAFGEVRVLDWGVASAVGRVALGGTRPYLAPEHQGAQATPSAPEMDVYALGVVLDRVLRGWGGESPAAPPALAALVASATAPDPAARPTMSQWASTLQQWLDGERARQEARALLREAAPLPEQARGLLARAEALEREAAERLSELAAWEPEARKAAAWDLEDEAGALRAEAQRLEGRYERALNAALRQDPELQEAHAQLADHHCARLLRFEAAGQEQEAAREEALLRGHGAARFAHILSGEGALCLTTDPPGAELELLRYERRRRRLHATPVARLTAPLVDHPLPRGSYLLRVRAPGRAPFQLPLVIARGARWRHEDARREEAPLWLPPADALGPEGCYVAPGWVSLGGDPEAPDGLPARALWLPGFVIQRTPVTLGAFLRFLALGPEEGEPERLERWGPRQLMGAGGDRLLVGRGPTGLEPLEGGLGVRAALDWPLTHVTLAAAERYAAWLAAREQRPWRLPHDHEWEKAARGADRRAYPWGDTLDPAWACMLLSHAGPPGPVSVHAFPEDESPYGVRGLGGNVRDWCANSYQRAGPTIVHGQLKRDDPPGELRMGRGGSWSSVASFCRAAGRFAGRPGDRLSSVGFRLVRSLGRSDPG